MVGARLPTQIACAINSSVLPFSSPLNPPPPLLSTLILFSVVFSILSPSISPSLHSSDVSPPAPRLLCFPPLSVYLSSLLYTPPFPSSILLFSSVFLSLSFFFLPSISRFLLTTENIPSSCYCYYVEGGNWTKVVDVCCVPHPCRPSSRTHPHPLRSAQPQLLTQNTHTHTHTNTHTILLRVYCLWIESKDREWTFWSQPLTNVLHVILIITLMLSSSSL